MNETPERSEWNVGQDDPEDRYPWRWTPNAEQPVDGVTLGWISTPNGRRPNGEMHTANLIASNIWEPDGHLICAVVNEWAHRMFGTPAPGDPMIPKADRQPSPGYVEADIAWCVEHDDTIEPDTEHCADMYRQGHPETPCRRVPLYIAAKSREASSYRCEPVMRVEVDQ